MNEAHTKIGLALGSGIARGWAHIGVIHALEEAGYKADVLAGTSIGAVVGGCHQAGKLDELEQFARSLTRRRMVGMLDFRFFSSGLLAGDKIKRLLETGLKDRTIESLPRDFISVTTELATGHEIWLSKGRLVDALVASYALPGVFQPVQQNNRWLVDGALVNPVPVSVCRAFGARLVIAVNLNQQVLGRGNLSSEPPQLAEPPPDHSHNDNNQSAKKILTRKLFGTSRNMPGVSTVMLGALNITQDRLTRSRLAGDPPDITIAPRMGHIGLLEFDRAEEAITLGYESARASLPYIDEAMALLS
ncbi:MAG: patatin-like phospholipase family protein [Parvularculales bacterium]